MADPTPIIEPLRFVETEAAGYCDPATGVCALPDANSPDAESPTLPEPPKTHPTVH